MANVTVTNADVESTGVYAYYLRALNGRGAPLRGNNYIPIFVYRINKAFSTDGDTSINVNLAFTQPTVSPVWWTAQRVINETSSIGYDVVHNTFSASYSDGLFSWPANDGACFEHNGRLSSTTGYYISTDNSFNHYSSAIVTPSVYLVLVADINGRCYGRLGIKTEEHPFQGNLPGIQSGVTQASQDNKGTATPLFPYNTQISATPGYQYFLNHADTNKDILNNIHLLDFQDPDANTESSGGAGGGGSGEPGGDTNEDDGTPSLSAVDCGLLTIFNPNNAQLKSLGAFLWSDKFDLNSFKKLFNNPFDSIFGLSIIPVQPQSSGNQNVFFGNIDTGVSMPVVKSQWVSVDMGTLDLSEIYNSALDYEPTTAVSIYLPYIGMRQLNTVDVMASSIHLIYKFDVLTGSVIAQLYVNHDKRDNTAGDFSKWTKNQGFLYSFAGQCAVSIPLSSQSFTNIIQAAINSVGIAAGAISTIATGNPALGVAALSVGTANIGIQASGSVVQRSGHLSGSQALLDYQTPMLIVIRPHRAKPSKYYNYRGVPSQTTTKLSECSGYTQIADGVSVSASGATDAELNEITSLLRSGVIF